MANLKQMMLDVIKKNTSFQTSSFDETEELIDTGLPKTEDNLQAAAIAYLDERGYRRRFDNVEYAKQMILDCSEGYDTIIVKQKRVVETNVFDKSGVAELRDAIEVCNADTLSQINEKLDRLVNRRFEYKVIMVTKIFMKYEVTKKALGENFEAFEDILNREAEQGWELDRIYTDDNTNTREDVRTYVVFRRAKFE